MRTSGYNTSQPLMEHEARDSVGIDQAYISRQFHPCDDPSDEAWAKDQSAETWLRQAIDGAPPFTALRHIGVESSLDGDIIQVVGPKQRLWMVERVDDWKDELPEKSTILCPVPRTSDWLGFDVWLEALLFTGGADHADSLVPDTNGLGLGSSKVHPVPRQLRSDAVTVHVTNNYNINVNILTTPALGQEIFAPKHCNPPPPIPPPPPFTEPKAQ